MLDHLLNILNLVPNQYFGKTERLFAYEFYHQFRKYREEENFLNDDLIVIDAELPKEVLTPEQAAEHNLLPLDSLMYPDFIIHERETGNHQLLVSEIKAERYLSQEKFIKDLNKLISYKVRYNFQYAVFIAINVDEEYLIEKLRGAHDLIMRDDNNIEIHIFTKLNGDSNWNQTTLSTLENELNG